MTWRVIEADCVEAMREMDEASVDAVVTDPPYFLGFMGKAWDTATPGDVQHGHDRWATEALRVLKPGGHLLAFGGTRTYHRLACAVEDAGFEIRDSVIWLYGSGFPKSLAVDKAIDKAAGAEREVVGKSQRHPGKPYDPEKGWNANNIGPEPGFITAPATPEAQRWQGWGTALKPAHEPIVVARKPLVGTVAQNVERFGTGAINVDACRIEGAPPSVPQPDFTTASERATRLDATARNGEMSQATGRWPANVCLSHLESCEWVGERRVKSQAPVYRREAKDAAADDGLIYGEMEPQPAGKQIGHADPDGLETVEAWACAPGCPVAELDRQSGERPSRPGQTKKSGRGNVYGEYGLVEDGPSYPGDTGGASRFFYVAKASRAERDSGLEKGDGVQRNLHPT